MVDLEALLGFDRNDPAQRLAYELADQDQELIRGLVQMRHDKGLRQEDVAEKLGVAQSTVAAFERSGNDPRLATIRRYAQAVGALVTHSVHSYYLDREAQRAARQLERSDAHTIATDTAEADWIIRVVTTHPSQRATHEEDVWTGD